MTEPNPEQLPSMTAAELRSVTEYLGVSQADIAEILGVDMRSVRRWFQGPMDGRTNSIPAGAESELVRLVAETDAEVESLVKHLRAEANPVVVVFRGDSEMISLAEGPIARHPARWWRHVAARAAAEVPGTRIAYMQE